MNENDFCGKELILGSLQIKQIDNDGDFWSLYMELENSDSMAYKTVHELYKMEKLYGIYISEIEEGIEKTYELICSYQANTRYLLPCIIAKDTNTKIWIHPRIRDNVQVNNFIKTLKI